MKKNEIALLIVIVSVVALLTYSIVNAFVGNAISKPVNVKKADVISKDVVLPSDTIFSDTAFNPTVKVSIGNQANRQPFTINQ